MEKILVVRNASSTEFYQMIKEAKENSKRTHFVHMYESEEYEQMQSLFVVDGGMAGIAVTSDGDVVSLFKNSITGEELVGAINLLLPIALMNGGRRMDCYGRFLTERYMHNGFIPVAKCKFERQYAAPDWDYERDGEPDIYFLCRSTSNIDDIVRGLGKKYGNHFESIDGVLPYMQYEEASIMTRNIEIWLRENNTPYEDIISLIIDGSIYNKEFDKK